MKVLNKPAKTTYKIELTKKEAGVIIGMYDAMEDVICPYMYKDEMDIAYKVAKKLRKAGVEKGSSYFIKALKKVDKRIKSVMSGGGFS